jgi:tetratricopeptide (TPR) repeat protein
MTAEVYMDMAHVYMKMSDLPETIKVLEKALVINEAERGEMSPECGKLNLNISGLYAQIGKFDRSLAFSKIALNIFEPHDVSFSQELLEATYMSAKSCDSLGDDSGKLFYAEKMYFILEKYLLKKYDYYEYSIK